MRTLPDSPTQLDSPSKVKQALLRRIRQLPLLPSSDPYNLTISYEKHFVWYRVAKVATRTIFQLLANAGVTPETRHPYNILYTPARYATFFKFAFIRNPWDRLVSCWHNKVVDNNYFKFDDATYPMMREYPNFVDYVAEMDLNTCDNHLRLQSKLIDLNSVDFIGRFENLNHDITEVFRRIGLPPPELTQENKSSKDRPYTAYYDDSLELKVRRMYERDIQIFGYEFD
jgi:hypothetical protein